MGLFEGEIFSGLLLNLEHNAFLYALIIPWITGDFGSHALGILAATSSFPLWIALVAPIVSEFVVETIMVFVLYFLKDKQWAVKKIERIKQGRFKGIFNNFDSLSLHKKIILFLSIRPLPGTRVLMILFISLVNSNIFNTLFVFYVSTFVWVFGLVFLGFLIGEFLQTFFADIIYMILALYLVVFVGVVLFLARKKKEGI